MLIKNYVSARCVEDKIPSCENVSLPVVRRLRRLWRRLFGAVSDLGFDPGGVDVLHVVVLEHWRQLRGQSGFEGLIQKVLIGLQLVMMGMQHL